MLKPTQPAASLGARTLYLGGPHAKRVAGSGEALLITSEHASSQHIPLARLARIVSNTGVDWAGSAIALCLQRGIAIAWASQRGEALGHAYPAQHTPLPAAVEVDLWLEQAHGPEQYQHWLRGRRLTVLQNWYRQNPNRINPQQWDNAKREWVYRASFNPHLPSMLHSHCHAAAAAMLASQGLPPVCWDANNHPVPLQNHLSQLLWADMNLTSGALADHPHGDRELADLFEHWYGHNSSTLYLHVQSLLRQARKAQFA